MPTAALPKRSGDARDAGNDSCNNATLLHLLHSCNLCDVRPTRAMIRFSVWLYRLAGWQRTALTLLVLVPLWALVMWALQGVAS